MEPWAWSIFYFAFCAYTYSRFFAHLDIYSCSCLLSGRWITWFIPGEASNLGRWVRSGSFWYWVQTLYFIKVNYYQIMNPIKGQDGNEKNKISIWSAFRIDLEIIKGSDFQLRHVVLDPLFLLRMSRQSRKPQLAHQTINPRMKQSTELPRKGLSKQFSSISTGDN